MEVGSEKKEELFLAFDFHPHLCVFHHSSCNPHVTLELNPRWVTHLIPLLLPPKFLYSSC